MVSFYTVLTLLLLFCLFSISRIVALTRNFSAPLHVYGHFYYEEVFLLCSFLKRIDRTRNILRLEFWRKRYRNFHILIEFQLIFVLEKSGIDSPLPSSFLLLHILFLL